MLRHAIAVSCLIALYSSTAPIVCAQEEYDEPAPSLTFGQKFDKFRRSLLGQEPAHAQPAHHRHSTDRMPPTGARSGQRSAGEKANPTPMVARSSRRAAETEPPRVDGRYSGRRADEADMNDEDYGASDEDYADEVYESPAPRTTSPRAASSRRAVDDSIDPAPVYDPGLASAAPQRVESPRRVDPPQRVESSQPAARTARVERREPASALEFGASNRRKPSTSDSGGVLFSRKSAQLVIETAGPRRIVIGKPSTYRVFVHNTGDVDANDVIVTIGLPNWAEVTQAKASSGSAAASADDQESHQWKLGVVPARSEEELNLQIVPHESRPFDLTVRWTSSPADSKTTVEVQEPKLALEIDGPAQVDCGAKQIYRLTVSNPGSGDAENVMLHLLPIEPGEGATAPHAIGTISGGDAKVVEIELAARQGGLLKIQAEATADDDLKADAATEVTVRQAVLKVQVTAPKRQFAGATGTYKFHISNPGNAAARQVQLAVKLPDGATFVSASGGGKEDARQQLVVWRIDSLPAGGEETLSMKCSIQSPGENRVDATVTAEEGLKEAGFAVTEVVALADLTLEVSDPAGPLPVSEEMVYEVRIRNRGSKDAEGVEVTAFFSNGIEPVSVEGGPHEISPGTVVLATIPRVAPGKELVYQIKAQAEQAGTHRFRVELVSPKTSTKLTQEESTIFYDDGAAGELPVETVENAASGGKKASRGRKPPSLNSPKGDNLKFVVPPRS